MIALGCDRQVTVIDFSKRKLVSQFNPTDEISNKLISQFPNCDAGHVTAMTASRSGPILFVVKDTMIYMCSGITGVELVRIYRQTPNEFIRNWAVELSDDEKTLIFWNETHLELWDIGDMLACLNKDYKPKQSKKKKVAFAK